MTLDSLWVMTDIRRQKLSPIYPLWNELHGGAQDCRIPYRITLKYHPAETTPELSFVLLCSILVFTQLVKKGIIQDFLLHELLLKPLHDILGPTADFNGQILRHLKSCVQSLQYQPPPWSQVRRKWPITCLFIVSGQKLEVEGIEYKDNLFTQEVRCKEEIKCSTKWGDAQNAMQIGKGILIE